MKKVITIIGVIVLIVLITMTILVSGRNFIAKKAIKYTAEKKMGLDARMESLNINLIKTSVNIEGLTLYNPQGFSKNKMVFIPRIYVDYILTDLLQNKIHIKKIDFYLKEILVERNEKGVNLQHVKLPSTKKRTKKSRERKKTPSKKKRKLKIDKFHLKIDRVKYINFTNRGKTKQIANINLDTTFNNINSLRELKTIIVAQIAPQTLLNKLKGGNMQDIKKSLKKGKKNIQEKIENLGESAKDLINDLSF